MSPKERKARSILERKPASRTMMELIKIGMKKNGF